jgi:hypothetical protein
VPPCNAHGVVYERVSGATLSVRDPQRLADLFRRGDAARREAQANADEAARWAHGELPRWFSVEEYMVAGTVAITRTGRAPDISAQLFRPDFVEQLETAAAKLKIDEAIPQAVQWTQQALMTALAGQLTLDRSGAVFATWQGATAVSFFYAGVDTVDPGRLVDRDVRDAWRIADELHTPLGGFGETFVTVRLAGQPMGVGPHSVEIRRGPLPAEYDLGSQLESVAREALRAAGRPAFEE